MFSRVFSRVADKGLGANCSPAFCPEAPGKTDSMSAMDRNSQTPGGLKIDDFRSQNLKKQSEKLIWFSQIVAPLKIMQKTFSEKLGDVLVDWSEST